MNGVHFVSTSRIIKNSTFGSLLVALYVFVSFFGLIAFYGMRAEYCRKLYYEFQNSTDPEVVKALPRFSWGFETNLDFRSGMLTGVLGGILAAAISFSVVIVAKYINSTKMRTVRPDYTAVLATVIVFVVYLFTFVLTSFFRNPSSLISMLDLTLAFIFAAISCLTTYLYILQIKRDYIFDNDLQLKQFELEHAGLRQILHLATWVFFLMFVGIFFVAFYEYFLAVPEVMSYTNAFRFSLVPMFAWAVLIILGYFAGVLGQLMSLMTDIVDAIREYGKERQEKSPR